MQKGDVSVRKFSNLKKFVAELQTIHVSVKKCDVSVRKFPDELQTRDVRVQKSLVKVQTRNANAQTTDVSIQFFRVIFHLIDVRLRKITT